MIERAPIAAVLCGGRSTRMGRDKATLVIDGLPMARRVADAIGAAGIGRVLAVGGDRDELTALGFEFVDDEHPGLGPVGGVITALHHGAGPVFVAACDMPWLTADAVAAVVCGLDTSGQSDGEGDDPADVAVAWSTRLEPLCAIWDQRALAPLQRFLAEGGRSVHRAIGELRAVHVPVPLAALRNVNAPGDIG